MKLKLTVLNWVQILLPHLLALIFYVYAENDSQNFIVLFFRMIYYFINIFLPLGGEFNYFRCLTAATIIIILFMLAPFMTYDRKTGRRFKTKYGMIDEYETVTANIKVDINYYFQIMLFHILLVVIYFYTADKIKLSDNVNHSSKIEKKYSNEKENNNNLQLNNEEDIYKEDVFENQDYSEVEEAERISSIAAAEEESQNSEENKRIKIFNISNYFKYSEAENECLGRDMRLPTYKELLFISKDDDLKKQLKIINSNQVFWSSTDYKIGEEYTDKQSVITNQIGEDKKKFKKTFNPFTEKTIITDVEIYESCICVD
jgi:hypothetical protein